MRRRDSSTEPVLRRRDSFVSVIWGLTAKGLSADIDVFTTVFIFIVQGLRETIKNTSEFESFF